jgi:hypothetical protein
VAAAERVRVAPAPGAQVIAWAADAEAHDGGGAGAPLAVARPLGAGRLVGVAVPHGLTVDGRPAPVWAALVARAARAALPVRVTGAVAAQVARNARGFVVGLYNPRGVDKPQQGLPIGPDRAAAAPVRLEARGVARAAEWLSGAELPVGPDGAVTLTVGAGATRVVELVLR